MPTFAAEEWPEWDRDERAEFLLDWPVKNSHLARLRRWHAEGRMTTAQAARFADLLRLIGRNRPILDAMDASLGP